WLDDSLAGVLYAHDDVEAGTEKLHKSFIETIGLGEAMVEDGQEAQPITFPDQSGAIDPIQSNDKYLWAQTIMNVKQDPSATNVQTLNTNTKNGVFASKVTNAGTSSTVEFTDPL
ncbi:transglutaminase, partial [Listeria monocytogenes]|nr:transglutaminase [Listeria monocytogenes]